MGIKNLTKEQIKFLAEECYCPEAAGFEGVETFPDCGECLICKCKEDAQELNN